MHQKHIDMKRQRGSLLWTGTCSGVKLVSWVLNRPPSYQCLSTLKTNNQDRQSFQFN